jgi:predicted amidohydrolase
MARRLGVPAIRADVTGRLSDRISHGSSGIVDREGRVLAAAEYLTPCLLMAELGI